MITTTEKIDNSNKKGIPFFCIGRPPSYAGIHVHLSQCGHIFSRKSWAQQSHNLCVECFL